MSGAAVGHLGPKPAGTASVPPHSQKDLLTLTQRLEVLSGACDVLRGRLAAERSAAPDRAHPPTTAELCRLLEDISELYSLIALPKEAAGDPPASGPLPGSLHPPSPSPSPSCP
eukprot:EG_transcript_58482